MQFRFIRIITEHVRGQSQELFNSNPELQEPRLVNRDILLFFLFFVTCFSLRICKFMFTVPCHYLFIFEKEYNATVVFARILPTLTPSGMFTKQLLNAFFIPPYS